MNLRIHRRGREVVHWLSRGVDIPPEVHARARAALGVGEDWEAVLAARVDAIVDSAG